MVVTADSSSDVLDARRVGCADLVVAVDLDFDVQAVVAQAGPPRARPGASPAKPTNWSGLVQGRSHRGPW